MKQEEENRLIDKLIDKVFDRLPWLKNLAYPTYPHVDGQRKPIRHPEISLYACPIDDYQVYSLSTIDTI